MYHLITTIIISSFISLPSSSSASFTSLWISHLDLSHSFVSKMNIFETFIHNLLNWFSSDTGSQLTQAVKPKLELKCMANVSNLCWHFLDEIKIDLTQRSLVNGTYYSVLMYSIVLITLVPLIYLSITQMAHSDLMSFDEADSTNLDHIEALSNQLIQINLILENMINDTRAALDCNTNGGLIMTYLVEKYTFRKLKSNLNKAISQFNKKLCLLNSN